MGAPQPVQATVVELWDIPFYDVRPQHTLIKSAATVVRDAEQADQVVPGGAYIRIWRWYREKIKKCSMNSEEEFEER